MSQVLLEKEISKLMKSILNIQLKLQKAAVFFLFVGVEDLKNSIVTVRPPFVHLFVHLGGVLH